MTAQPQPAAISRTIVLLALLAAIAAVAGIFGSGLPLLSNTRLDIVVVVVLGMAICGMGGIGRVAATGQWRHPLSIIGYILGVLILVIAAAALLGWSLPLLNGDQQALVTIVVLAVAKMLISIWHSVRAPNPGIVQASQTRDV